MGVWQDVGCVGNGWGCGGYVGIVGVGFFVGLEGRSTTFMPLCPL